MGDDKMRVRNSDDGDTSSSNSSSTSSSESDSSSSDSNEDALDLDQFEIREDTLIMEYDEIRILHKEGIWP